jgi:hypothetical protein
VPPPLLLAIIGTTDALHPPLGNTAMEKTAMRFDAAVKKLTSPPKYVNWSMMPPSKSDGMPVYAIK